MTGTHHWRLPAREHPYRLDAAVAALLCAATVLTTGYGPKAMRGPLDLTEVLLGLAAYTAVAVRRRWPLPALAVVVVAGEAYMIRSQGHGWMVVAPMLTLYTVAERGSRRRTVLAGALSVVGLVLLRALMVPSSKLGWESLAMAALVALAMSLGDLARTQRRYIDAVEERAVRAERDRDREALRRVTEERLRIARDLHDAVGHQLALINVQAAVAAHVLDSRPDQAREALGHVRRAGTAALAELRDTLGLLRLPGEPDAPTGPAVGLCGLGELLEAYRHSGLPVSYRVEGRPGGLNPAVDLTAYRVVQEALTNVCRHAPGSRATVEVRYGPAELTITVTNGAAHRPAGTSPGGLGLVGMRERVGALGGRLYAGPRPDGGFRVTATLPSGVPVAPAVVAVA